MAARSIGKGTISFGFVSIPVKLYTATRPQSVSFNMLHADCGSPISQQRVCTQHDPVPVLKSENIVKGFEHSRDAYVQFTPEELKALEAARPTQLELLEFVPEDTVDFLFIEKTYYLGPDIGGDDGYHVLARAMERTRRLAVGLFANRGKDTLVLLRPYRGGLLLHEAFYENEVLPWEEIPLGNPKPMSPLMLSTAELLVEKLERARFEPGRFRDKWAEKVLALVASKVAGNAVVLEPEKPKTTIVDLIEALKRSVTDIEKKVESEREGVAKSTVLPKGAPRKAAPRSKAAAAEKKGKRNASDER
ncbi:MAG: end-binding protein Ku [Gaiellaceae bacterium]|jgi:DNA end-binding protein Ku|nr:end-binding protein Ku [Gaiellaceae bacterium]